MRLGFQLVTDVRDSSMGPPSRPGPFGGELPSRPGQFGADLPGRRPSAGPSLPNRQGTLRPPRPAGRHRRAVPASLPESAPALVLAVPGSGDGVLSGAVAELTTVLRVENPAVDVQAARIESSHSEPTGIRAVLANAAARRPAGVPCAVVIPLLATPHPPVLRKLREAILASEVNAPVSEFINANALLAEALHIRLAESGLARADRVRLFSIVTAADGIILATAGGTEAAQAASITSVLLAARLALPVIAASLDGQPTVQEAAMRLKEMGATRLAMAPCVIGPEITRADLDPMVLGIESAAPLGAHGNIAKLAAMAYGQAIDQMVLPGDHVQP